MFRPFRARILRTTFRALLHDPDVYPDPESFYPERFEQENVPDPIDYAAFGYGRR